MFIFKKFKESCKTIYLEDTTQSKIDEYLKIYENMMTHLML